MNDLSYMARFGARLVTNGYGILPIGPGTKKPGQFKRGAWVDYPEWNRHAERPTTEVELRRGRHGPIAALGLLAVRLLQSISISLRMQGWRSASSNSPATGWATPKPTDRKSAEAHADLPHDGTVPGHQAPPIGSTVPRPAVPGVCNPSRHWRTLCLARGRAG